MNETRSAGRVIGSRWVAAGLAAFVSLSAQAQAGDARDEGAKLFQQHCVACHTLGGGRLVGPDLKGVTARRSREWIVRFVTDPAPMLERDPDAIALLKQYGIPMPKLGLAEPQVSALVVYLDAGQAPPAATPDPFVPTLVASALAIAALTWIGLAAGKRTALKGLA